MYAFLIPNFLSGGSEIQIPMIYKRRFNLRNSSSDKMKTTTIIPFFMFTLFVFVTVVATEIETKRTTIELKPLKPLEAKNQILKAPQFDEKILIEPLKTIPSQNLENPTEKEMDVPVEESVPKNQDEMEANEAQDEDTMDETFWNDSWGTDSSVDEKDSKFNPETFMNQKKNSLF
jgi:hypothetical protein